MMGLINWLFPQGVEAAADDEDALCRCEHRLLLHAPTGHCTVPGCDCRVAELLIEDLGCGC